jgi:hypothetical protein
MASTAEKSQNKLKNSKAQSHRVSPDNRTKVSNFHNAMPNQSIETEVFEDIPNELESDDYEYAQENMQREKFNSENYSQKDVQVNSTPTSSSNKKNSSLRLNEKTSQKEIINIRNLKKNSHNEDYLMSLLNNSQRIISVFRTKQSFVHETRSKMAQRPKESFRRSPERIFEIDSDFKVQRGAQSMLTSPSNRRKMNKSPSLLITRRKLSPSKEIIRDNYIGMKS